MAQSESSKVSYFNTLIFTIVSGIISLILLILLFLKIGQDWAYLILTVEVGIFIVIGICVFQIIRNEKIRNNLKNNLEERISFYECPDYFNKVSIDNINYCKNDHTYTNTDGRKYTMKIYPDDPSTPLPPSLPAVNTSKNESFPLNEIEQTVQFKTAIEECNMVLNEPNLAQASSSAEKDFLKKYEGYSKLPWTHARSRCAAYVDNT